MRIEPDLKTETGRRWAELIRQARAADAPPAKPARAKRFTGPTAQSKAWVREQCAKPGRFFQTARLHNWNNARMHWAKAAAIHADQRQAAYAETLALLAGRRPAPPLVVVLTRYGPRTMDDDGNASALKYFRDGVAAALGIDDGDVERLTFRYEQEAARWHGVRIRVGTAAAAPSSN